MERELVGEKDSDGEKVGEKDWAMPMTLRRKNFHLAKSLKELYPLHSTWESSCDGKDVDKFSAK